MIFCRGLILLLLFDLNLAAQTFITNNDWDFHLNIRDVNHMALTIILFTVLAQMDFFL